MPMDMSDALAPEFIDTICVVSTTRVIGSDGRSTDTASAPCVLYAVVVPKPQTMMREADGSRIAASIEIYSTTQLTTGSKASDTNSQAADIVTWHSRQYTVTDVGDFGAFGPGFWRATAELLPLNPSVLS